MRAVTTWQPSLSSSLSRRCSSEGSSACAFSCDGTINPGRAWRERAFARSTRALTLACTKAVSEGALVGYMKCVQGYHRLIFASHRLTTRMSSQPGEESLPAQPSAVWRDLIATFQSLKVVLENGFEDPIRDDLWWRIDRFPLASEGKPTARMLTQARILREFCALPTVPTSSAATRAIAQAADCMESLALTEGSDTSPFRVCISCLDARGPLSTADLHQV